MLGNFDFSVILHSLPYLIGTGLVFTIKLTLLAMLGGWIFGTLLALLRLSPIRPLSLLAGGYVSLIRSIPLVMVIFWFYFLVPYIGGWVIGAKEPIQVGAFNSSLLTFIMYEAAYYCEIMRSGIRSVARGQGAAARALGMTYLQAMFHIIMPQAIRNMLPILLTQSIVLFQDISLVYVVSITDFLGAASTVAQRDGRLVEMYSFVAVLYFFMSYALSRSVRTLDAKLKLAK